MELELSARAMEEIAVKTSNLTDLADEIIPEIMGNIEADGGSILVGRRGILEVLTAFGLKTNRATQTRIPYGVGITGQAAEANTIQWIPDVGEEDNHIEGIPDSEWELSIPLSHPDRDIMVIVDFESSSEARPSTEQRNEIVDNLKSIKFPILNLAENNCLRNFYREDTMSSLMTQQHFFDSMQDWMDQDIEHQGLLIVAELEPRLNDPEISTFRDLNSELNGLGSRLKGLFSNNTFLSRLYGNYFVFFERNVDKAEVDETENHISDLLNQVCNVKELNTVHQSKVQDDVKSLLNNAFIDINFTKNQSKNSNSMNLHEILRTGSISLSKQPIIDSRTESIVGHEILVRGPEDTAFHSPGRLFEAAYQEDRVVELDTLIIRRALQSSIPSDGETLFLNVERKSIVDSEWRNTFTDLIRTGSGDFDVCVEITEHGQLKDFESHLCELRNTLNGSVNYAIDDFGTGSSNFEAIIDLDPDILKVDRSLIRNVHNEFQKRSFIESIMEFTNKNGTQVLAEGIEALDEWKTLKELGIDWAQGYYFGKPEPVNS